MFKKGNGKHGSEYLFVRFTKTLPIIKYSENLRYYRHREVVEDRKSRIHSELSNEDRSSPNSDGYVSNWTDGDTAASSISGSINMVNDTIPLQYTIDDFNDMTPIMIGTDSDIVTPAISPTFSEDTPTTPIYGNTRLEALKIYLEEKLHEIEQTSNADKKSDSSSSYSLTSPTSLAQRMKQIKKQSRKRKKLKERKKQLSEKRKDKTSIKSVSDQLDYIVSLEKRSATSSAAVQKISPTNHRSRSLQSNKMHSSDLNSRIKRENGPPSRRHRSSRSRKNSSHRSRRRARESSKLKRSLRKSPRSQSSSRSCSPVVLRKKTKIIPTHETSQFYDKQTNRKWELSPPEQTKSSTKSAQDSEHDATQPICRIGSENFENQNFELPKYDCYQSLRKQSSAHDSFEQSDQLCDFHQASGVHMSQFKYFQSSSQPLSLEQRFSNFSESCQSNGADMERNPFVRKENMMEIVSTIQSVVDPPVTDSTLLNDVSSKLDERIEIKIKTELVVDPPVADLTLLNNVSSKLEEFIEQCKSKKVELNLKRKQKRDKKHLERLMRKEKLRLEIELLNELCEPIPGAVKVTLNRDITDRKKNDTSSSKNENASTSVVTASGDKTSSEAEDITRLLYDCTIEKLDTTRCRAEKKATIIRKETVEDILPLIDAELENMPPPLPPEGSPPPHLLQPKLKFIPKLIYFHYNLESNTMEVSSHRTPPIHIPRTLSGKTFSAPKTPTDSHKAAKSTVEQCSAQNAGPMLASQSNKYQQSHASDTNSINSSPARTLPPKKSFTEIHSKSKSSVRRSPQSSAMNSQKNSLSYQVHTVTPCKQIQPLPQIWESDVCFPQYANLTGFNKVPPQKPAHVPWKQQQPPSLFEIFVSPPESSSLGNIQSHPGPNHPIFYENQLMNFNLAQGHQQQNDFRLNAPLNHNMRPKKQWKR